MGAAELLRMHFCEDPCEAFVRAKLAKKRKRRRRKIRQPGAARIPRVKGSRLKLAADSDVFRANDQGSRAKSGIGGGGPRWRCHKEGGRLDRRRARRLAPPSRSGVERGVWNRRHRQAWQEGRERFVAVGGSTEQGIKSDAVARLPWVTVAALVIDKPATPCARRTVNRERHPKAAAAHGRPARQNRGSLQLHQRSAGPPFYP
jgi:hypothetical protein